ncbi:hypothetical protein CI593_10930 [Fischerella thermalis CCMEE 5194]|nr:hypothetical protein CI593_10930 [Fischerella thermalis CCMEE 5194]
MVKGKGRGQRAEGKGQKAEGRRQREGQILILHPTLREAAQRTSTPFILHTSSFSLLLTSYIA